MCTSGNVWSCTVWHYWIYPFIWFKIFNPNPTSQILVFLHLLYYSCNLAWYLKAEALTVGQWTAFLKGFCKNIFEVDFVRPRNHLVGWDFQWTSPNLASAGRSPTCSLSARPIDLNQPLFALSLSKLLKLWGDTKITKFTKIRQNEKSAESQE